MEKDVNFFVGLLWGGLFSIVLWIAFFQLVVLL